MTRRSTAPAAHCNQLDPRDSDDALARPIAAAVNIPLSEMAGRTHELPAKDEMIDVVGPPDMAARAVEWLSANGRRGRSVERFDFADANAEAVTWRLWRPNSWLERILPELEPGRALDLACGMGREPAHSYADKCPVSRIDCNLAVYLRGCPAPSTPHWLDYKEVFLPETGSGRDYTAIETLVRPSYRKRCSKVINLEKII